jgi:hypothetical protein
MKSYSPKMTPTNQDRITQMMANENIIISDKLMKLEVENKEMFSRYHKLRRAFNELLDEHQEIRERHYQHNTQYDWVEKAGLLDDVE